MTRYVAFTVTKTIRQDYDRRGVFPEIRPGELSHQKTWPNGELYWVTDDKLALKLLEDADEQHSLRRDRSGAGITRAYGSLRRSLLNGLRRNFGFDPSEIFDSCSHSMMDEVTQS